MRKRTIWIGLGVLAGLWLVPAAFVSLYDPSVTHVPTEGLSGAVESALGAREPEFFLLSHGYRKHWAVETRQGETEAEVEADVTRADYYVERGSLDRRAGTYRFTLRCHMNHARDLEGVRLFVTSVGDWSGADSSVWTQLAEAMVKKSGAEEVALLCEAVVPAATTAYRVEELRSGAPCNGFSQSMLTAPTFLGRAYDTIAWHPLFRWVPELR